MIGWCRVRIGKKWGGYPPYLKTVKFMILKWLEVKYSKDWI